MSDLKLFRIDSSGVNELPVHSVSMEKSLQTLIERNLEAFLGVRFLASEYATGKTHGGRIDTLGIDENGYPVIIEYKRSMNENVINQGLFYLDWLLDHKAEFQILVQNNLGYENAAGIEWTSPRLLCIAGDFTRYDEHAVQQINRNIELIRYRRYGDELLLFELVNAPVQAEVTVATTSAKAVPSGSSTKSATDDLAQASDELRDLFDALQTYTMALGDDVQMNVLKNYFAFKRLKNFACVEVHTRQNRLLMFVKVDPNTVALETGFTRDVRNIGHYGTGDLEITVQTMEDLERAKPLIVQSYEAN